MAIAAFMHKVGRLKLMPATWTDLFLLDVQSFGDSVCADHAN
jgi:hypothetical protein